MKYRCHVSALALVTILAACGDDGGNGNDNGNDNGNGNGNTNGKTDGGNAVTGSGVCPRAYQADARLGSYDEFQGIGMIGISAFFTEGDHIISIIGLFQVRGGARRLVELDDDSGGDAGE